MKRCSVNINGCDDSTRFNMEVTNEEYDFLLKLARLSRYTSTYGCEPTIEIGEEINFKLDE